MEYVKKPIIHCWIYKYFGVETKKYKKWWEYYSWYIQTLLNVSKVIYTKET